MPEKTTATENQKGLTIREAIAYLGKKYKTGAYQDVIDGCQDILDVEPKQTKAKNLLQKAQKKLQNPSQKNSYNTKIIIAVGAIVIVIGSSVLWQFTKPDEPLITHDRNSQNDEDNSAAANERKVRNEQRLTDLTNVQNALKEAYKRDHAYPTAETVNDTLENGGFIDDIPHDPLNTDTFSYMYAVYDNVKGERQEYILSGIFEENNGENIVWTLGAKATEHTDYRDDTLDHVTAL